MTLWDEIIDTYLESGFEHRYVIDLIEGIITLDGDEVMTGEAGIDWDDPNAWDRYLPIPQCDSSEAYACRERFTAEDASGRLMDALAGSRPFRRFKDALTQLGLWDSWSAFERAWARDELESWVDELPVPYNVLEEKYQAYWNASKEPEGPG